MSSPGHGMYGTKLVLLHSYDTYPPRKRYALTRTGYTRASLQRNVELAGKLALIPKENEIKHTDPPPKLLHGRTHAAKMKKQNRPTSRKPHDAAGMERVAIVPERPSVATRTDLLSVYPDTYFHVAVSQHAACSRAKIRSPRMWCRMITLC